MLSSVALVAAVSGLLWAEKHLQQAAAPESPATGQTGKGVNADVALFYCAVALLGLGYQVHFALNSAPAYLRFAKPADLEYLMPVFWIGFNVLILSLIHI